MFLVVLYDAVRIQDCIVLIVRWLLNVKIWKKTVMAKPRYYPSIYLAERSEENPPNFKSG